MIGTPRTLCRTSLLAVCVVLGVGWEARAQHQHDDLGSVSFPTSCQPSVQTQFERGVAMLHSYWFNYAGKTFRAVLEQDPKCAIAYWGVALDLLGNTLSGPPSPARAKRVGGARTGAQGAGEVEREHEWLDRARLFRDSTA